MLHKSVFPEGVDMHISANENWSNDRVAISQSITNQEIPLTTLRVTQYVPAEDNPFYCTNKQRALRWWRSIMHSNAVKRSKAE